MRRRCRQIIAKIATEIIFSGIMLEVRLEYSLDFIKRYWKFLKIYFKYGL